MLTKQLGKKLRKEFPVFDYNARHTKDEIRPFHYLDSAASAQKPSAVIDALHSFIEHKYATVHRGAYALSAQSTVMYESTRHEVAKFLGSSFDSSHIVFTKGTTESLNMLASGLSETVLTKSSRIVLPMSEHHSNLVPWQQAALKKDCELAYIHLNGKQGDGLALNLNEASKLITKNTKVVTFSHMGNVLGQINPIEELISLAKAVNAIVIIDCAQSITCLNQNLFALGADAIAFSGHKFYGPTGIGVLALTKSLAEILPPFMFGGGMVSAVSEEGANWVDPPHKFEAGTPPITEAIGLSAAINWYNTLGGQEKIHNHCSKLASQFITGLKKIKEIEIFSPESGRETLVSFRHKTIHSHDLTTILDAHNIALRSGHHCAWPLIHHLGVDALCRASFGVYNDEDDVESSLEVIKNHRFLN